MSELPKQIYEPKPGPKRPLRRWRLTEPDDGDGNPSALVQSGTIRQNELDADDLIPAGQELESVEYEECQFARGSEQEIGNSGPCTIYKILYTCSTVTEIWWLRIPPVRMSVTSKPKWCVWKAVIICPDGTWSVAPLEIWEETGKYDSRDDSHAGDPPPPRPGAKPKIVYLPPREEPIVVTSGQGHRDGKFLIEKDNFFELVPPYSITGCWYTARYKKRTRIKKTDTIDNTSTVTVEDFVPEMIEQRTNRIPGCIDETPGGQQRERESQEDR